MSPYEGRGSSCGYQEVRRANVENRELDVLGYRRTQLGRRNLSDDTKEKERKRLSCRGWKLEKRNWGNDSGRKEDLSSRPTRSRRWGFFSDWHTGGATRDSGEGREKACGEATSGGLGAGKRRRHS